jgi:hypothetical protein
MEEVNTGVTGVVATRPAAKKKHSRSGAYAGKSKGSEGYREADAEQTRQRRATKKAQAELEAQGLRSDLELSKKEITRLLIDERKLRPHVAAQYAGLVGVAARAHRIPANQFLCRYGLKNTLAALQEKPVELPGLAQEIVDGEVLFKNELDFAYDFSMFHQPEVSFEQFLEQRFKCKSNAMHISKLFDKDFADCHRRWTEEFFPQIDSRGLEPNYTQQQARQWLARQSEHFKTFLLLASRNSFKSSWSKFFVLSLVAAYPDVRVILVSETHELSTLFVGELRQYLEVRDGEVPNKYLQLFPEVAVPAGEGSSMAYEHPIRHLRLPAPTIRSTSVDASVTGGRYDLLVCDDILSDQSCGNEKQTKSTISRFESFWKLGEVGSALTLILGTPWSENPPDLYKTLVDRATADLDTNIAVRIDPIMDIKPHARNKKLTALVEDDIEGFLFPERLDWKFIRSEIMKNPKDTTFFESQNLCRFVPPEESKWKVNFDEDELRNLVVFQTRFLGWASLRSILSVDTANSANRYANMSCIAFSKLFEDAKDGKRYFAVIDVDADKYRPSEIASHIASAWQKYSPDVVTIERPGLWQALQTLIEQEANRRGFSLVNRIHWREPGNSTAKGKAARIKNLEPLVKNQQLLFLQGNWNELVIQQALHWDGVKKSGSAPHSLDDTIDAISMGVERVAVELLKVLPPQKSEREMEADVLAQANAVRAAHYDRMFSGSVIPFIPKSTEMEAAPRNPVLDTLGRFGMVRQ